MKFTYMLTALAIAPVALAAPAPEGLEIVARHKKDKNETKHHKEKHHKNKHHKNKTEKHHKNERREVTQLLM
ncbi:Hypothetical protein conserved in the Yarrowia clade [Yarrowia lipolytica]|uniref:Uncharacterized protein n=1 Tax=Yarrowia lipolytica TaxID=4952 RepID=A0A1D8NFC5_YARLL|nr:hypothetical protein YALI1_D24546g [Yarrowia lipolytica]KAB8280464.1 hypothetical protein BKA91DRAFT_141912 [Yarrowia lipolytica]KAE8169532.1 hypothetical protein BKA90DRAFT_142404 [Yarrowia lipolytica]RMI99490.1 hypothetical protein BD777DRAFT_124113 [Yarrowia lipolytica]VBB88277.1 Hypothetical protein conserved in the Yarrowia clade [Yarrowia lipolytica]